MKQLLPILGILTLFSGKTLAQKDFILSRVHPRTTVHVTAGYSIPTLSPFGKNKQNLMGNGHSAAASVGYRFGRILGLVGTYAYLANTIRRDGLLEMIDTPMNTQDWITSTSRCTLQSVMVGPMVSLPRGRFVFDVQLTAGIARALSPRMEAYPEQAGAQARYDAPAQTTYAPSVGLGVTTRYKLSRWLAVQASVQYLAANLKYRDLVQVVQMGNQQSTEPMPAHQPVGMVNAGGGFSFSF